MVQGAARSLARLRLPLAAALSRLLRAGLASDEGHAEQAVTHLRSALTAFEDGGMRASSIAVRRQLGKILGGSEGAALVAQTETALVAIGAVDLEATTRLLAWGTQTVEPPEDRGTMGRSR